MRKLLSARGFPEIDIALDMIMHCGMCTETMMGIRTKKQDQNTMMWSDFDLDDDEFPRDYDHEFN